MELKQVPEARKSIEQAIKEDPELVEAYEAGIHVSLADQNFDETVKYLTILTEKFDRGWDDLTEVPGFQEFVKSEQYRKWQQSQQEK